jgi:hypothetical protein
MQATEEYYLNRIAELEAKLEKIRYYAEMMGTQVFLDIVND